MEKAPEGTIERINRRARGVADGTTGCLHKGGLAKDCYRCMIELLWDCEGEGWNRGHTYATDAEEGQKSL